MASGIENMQRLRKALKHAEKARDFIKQMADDGAQGERIFEAEKQAKALVTHLQATLDAIDNVVVNHLNS